MRRPDPVAATLATVALLGVCALPFLLDRPDRLQPGTGVSLFAACGVGQAALVLAPLALSLGAAFVVRAAVLRPMLAAAASLAIPLEAGLAARHLHGWPGLGSGLFVAETVSLLALAQPRGGARVLAAALFGAGALLAGWLGAFSALSLAREFDARGAAVATATFRHAELASAAIGLPLGLLAHVRRRTAPALFATLNALQTIPSIAAFGLLIAPLSWLAAAVPALGRLGIAGVGAAPALIALTAYALLPIARNTQAGFAAIDPATREAATAMGFSPARRLRAVELPLALRPILAGLRVASVQTIGLATVASLIGAGGLGSFVFEGIGEDATDVVLLGALPILALALAADAVFALFERAAP